MKSVRFKNEVQIFFIPSRNACHNIPYWLTNYDTDVQSAKSIKSVTFYATVDIQFVPSRDDLKQYANEIWYGHDDFGNVVLS